MGRSARDRARYLHLIGLVSFFLGMIPSSNLAAPTPSTTVPGGPQTLTIVSDDNYPPFIFRSSVGQLKGYLVDYWGLWEKKTGVRVNLIGMEWSRAIAVMRSGQADVIETVFYTEERDRFLDYAPAYADIPVPVYVRKTLGDFTSLKGLLPFKMAVKEGDACVERLKAAGITRFDLYPSYEAIVRAAEDGQVDVFCVDGPPADFLMAKVRLQNDFKKAVFLYTGQMHYATRQGATALMTLLRSGDQRITLGERKRLRAAWLQSEGDWGSSFRYAGWGLLALLLIAFGAFAWVWMLRHEVAQRTAQLDAEHRQLRALVEAIPEMVWLRDTRGVYRFCNPIASGLFGFKETDVVGKTDHELFSGELAEAFGASDREAIERRGAVRFEETIPMPQTGAKVDLDVVKTPVFDGRGNLLGVLGIARDITQSKRDRERWEQLQERLRQAQKLESLGVLAGGIAHDFNNLLTSILGNTDLASEQVPATSSVRENLLGIESATRRAAELCKQMLAYSGKGRLLVRPLDLRSMLEEMSNILAATLGPNIETRYHFAERLPSIEADAAQIRQVVMNVILNAGESIGERDGIVDIKTGVADCDEAFLKTMAVGMDAPPGRYVTLEIVDTGCGMDLETLQRMFDPFFTTKFTGRGLGLAAVSGIVRGHRGAIHVTSEMGKGTRFVLYFPAVGEGSSVVSRVPTTGEASVQRTAILLEPDSAVREVGRSALQRAGWLVLTASDTSAALSILRAVHTVDGLLVDLDLNGLEIEAFLDAASQERPGLKTILLSVYDEEDTLERLKGKGVVALLQKPYTASQLIETTRRVFAVHSGRV